jgi:hypothetical protein
MLRIKPSSTIAGLIIGLVLGLALSVGFGSGKAGESLKFANDKQLHFYGNVIGTTALLNVPQLSKTEAVAIILAVDIGKELVDGYTNWTHRFDQRKFSWPDMFYNLGGIFSAYLMHEYLTIRW